MHPNQLDLLLEQQYYSSSMHTYTCCIHNSNVCTVAGRRKCILTTLELFCLTKYELVRTTNFTRICVTNIIRKTVRATSRTEQLMFPMLSYEVLCIPSSTPSYQLVVGVCILASQQQQLLYEQRIRSYTTLVVHLLYARSMHNTSIMHTTSSYQLCIV